MAYTILVADCYIYIMAYTPKLVSLQRCDLQCSLQPRTVSRPIALISPDCALGMRRPKIIRAQRCRRIELRFILRLIHAHAYSCICIGVPPSLHPSPHPSVHACTPPSSQPAISVK